MITHESPTHRLNARVKVQSTDGIFEGLKKHLVSSDMSDNQA